MERIDWLNGLILVMVVIGQSTLLVTFINRIHALAWPETLLKLIRQSVDASLFVFPIVLFACVGFAGPALLWGGELQDLSVFWKILFSVAALGFIGFLISLMRNQLNRAPLRQISETAVSINVEKLLGFRPSKTGPYSALCNVPFNQQFEFEITDKTLVFDTLPAHFDGLKILHLSDWHFSGSVDLPYFLKVCETLETEEYDLICFSGDLVDQAELISWIPQTLGRLRARFGKFYVLGNHDWFSGTLSSREVLESLGWTDLASSVQSIQVGRDLIQFGGDETPWMGSHPEFQKEQLPGQTLFKILISHTPDNFHWAADQGVDLVLAGHTHGGQVRLPLIGPVFSPSVHGCRYASGTFERKQTLMHVSRGLSGIHPLRISCAPEVTRLTLVKSPAGRSEAALSAVAFARGEQSLEVSRPVV